jgi:hypothetical protein
VREPLKRLVAAFLWCQKAGLDPLCANHMLSPSWFDRTNASGHLVQKGMGATKPHRVSLEVFAEHFGNYLMREMLFSEWPSADAVCGIACRARAASPLAAARALNSHFKLPWYVLKLALNGSDDTRTRAGRATLHRTERWLRRRGYDTIGIMERWSDTMRLFEEAMPLANTSRGWASEMAQWRVHGTNGTVSSKWSCLLHGNSSTGDVPDWVMHACQRQNADAAKRVADEEKYLNIARSSPRVRAAIAGDLYLYSHVLVPLFERQLLAHGLATSSTSAAPAPPMLPTME